MLEHSSVFPTPPGPKTTHLCDADAMPAFDPNLRFGASAPGEPAGLGGGGAAGLDAFGGVAGGGGVTVDMLGDLKLGM